MQPHATEFQLFIPPPDEEVFQLTESHKVINKSYDTILKYAKLGKVSKVDGKTLHRLEVFYNPTLATTVEAYRRFIVRLNSAGKKPVRRQRA